MGLPRKSLGTLTLVLAAAALQAPPSGAASGDLDPSFSGDGYRTLDVGRQYSYRLPDVAVQPDGRVLMLSEDLVGHRYGSPNDLLVLRLRPDGRFDASFGRNGQVTLDFAGEDTPYTWPDWPASLEVRPDGGIVVTALVGVGKSTNHGRRLGIAVLDPDGSLNGSFSRDGMAILHKGTVQHVADAALASDGAVYALGKQHGKAFLARFAPTGQLDEGFSGDGIVRATGYPVAIAVDEALPGPVVLIRSTSQACAHGMTVRSYRTTGTRNPVFSNGSRTVCFGELTIEPSAMAISEAGKVVIGGTRPPGRGLRGHEFAFARLLLDGQLDPSFSENGRTLIHLGDQDGHLSALAVEGEDVYAAGAVEAPNSFTCTDCFDWAVAALDDAGQPNAQFSDDGWRLLPVFEDWENEAAAIQLSPGGHLMLGGLDQTQDDNYELALARIEAASP